MKLGVVGHTGYTGLTKLLKTLFRVAPTLDFQLYFENELYEVAKGGSLLESCDELDALLTLGGDGTLLRGARLLNDNSIPILGVNLGRLGFLTSCLSSEMEPALQRLASGEYEAVSRMTLRGVAINANGVESGSWRALNDFVLHKGGFARMVRLDVRVNGELVSTYAADGIIVSTPTGSTAYSLSAGGPVVLHELESILLTPISAHALAIRPLVLPPTAEVEISGTDGRDELIVTADGQVGMKLVGKDKLVIRRSSSPVKIVRFSESNFFEKLRLKLGWGGMPARDNNQ